MAKKNRIAIYAGSFDPITNGHLDIINRALKIFDELHVVIAVNPAKTYVFSKEDRVNFIEESCKDLSNLVITHHDGLIADYAIKVGAEVLVRGLRAMSDFDYEFHMATINRAIQENLETVFISTGEKYFYINSTVVRELAKNNKDVSAFVPSAVSKKLLSLRK